MIDEFEPCKEAIRRYVAIHSCYDCQKIIDVDKDTHLKSHPNVFRTRYRCVKCGLSHQKFKRLEFWEQWHIGNSTFSRNAIKVLNEKNLL